MAHCSWSDLKRFWILNFFQDSIKIKLQRQKHPNTKIILYLSAELLQQTRQNNPSISQSSAVTESDTCRLLNSSVTVDTFIHYSTLSVNIHSVCVAPRGIQTRNPFPRQHFISKNPSFQRGSSFFSPSAYNSIRAGSARAAVSITGCILLINTWPGGGRL